MGKEAVLLADVMVQGMQSLPGDLASALTAEVPPLGGDDPGGEGEARRSDGGYLRLLRGIYRQAKARTVGVQVSKIVEEVKRSA
ncbi:MAG: hypothetical protein BWY25_00427 [Chloroflexi bacterium ADurb.Bin222]|nr:MAG: hypothetical protein BWY25_00427 [Chloroflexi bacterium ADurb.Bin222]